MCCDKLNDLHLSHPTPGALVNTRRLIEIKGEWEGCGVLLKKPVPWDKGLGGLLIHPISVSTKILWQQGRATLLRLYAIY